MKTIVLSFLLALTTISRLYAQFEASDYVYLLLISNPDKKTETTFQTGFKIEGQRGIYTALHGIAHNFGKNGTVNIKAIILNKATSISKVVYDSLQIVGIDMSKDLALLDNKNIKFTTSGFKTYRSNNRNEPYYPKYNDILKVYGFPQTQFLLSNPVTVLDPSKINLEVLLNGSSNLDSFKERNSPSLNQDVIQLGRNQILPGNSGGPIVDSLNYLIGIAHGSRKNTQNNDISTFSIPWYSSNLSLAQFNNKDKSFKKLISKTGNLYSYNELAKQISNNENLTYYGATNFPKKYPTYIVSISWSRPVEIQSNGILISTNLQDFNANLDITLDKRIYKFLYIGAYVSSKYLQYQMLSKFNHDLPLLGDAYNRSTKKIFDTYGLQVSVIMFRGVLWHTYIGVGGFYNGIDNLQNNQRAFVGFRKYLFHKQHISLDFKALNTSQNQFTFRPTLGNAQPNVQQFKQYYLCAGINYSFQSKN